MCADMPHLRWVDFQEMLSKGKKNGCGGMLKKKEGKKGGRKLKAHPQEKTNTPGGGPVEKTNPAAAKGQYIRSCVAAATMGPGVRMNTAKLV